MGKIVLLVPREDMVRQAHNILQEKKQRKMEHAQAPHAHDP